MLEHVAGKSEIDTAIGQPTEIRQLAYMSVNAGCDMFRNSRPFIDRESLPCPDLVNKVAMTGSKVQDRVIVPDHKAKMEVPKGVPQHRTAGIRGESALEVFFGVGHPLTILYLRLGDDCSRPDSLQF